MKMKVLSKSRRTQDTRADAAILQRTINRLHGGGMMPRGVYRFRTFEEADQWTLREMAHSSLARRTSKTS